MEPERDLHLGRMLGQRQMTLAQGQAFAQVLLRVVVALRLGIGGEQAITQRDALPGRAQRRPATGPRRLEDGSRHARFVPPNAPSGPARGLLDSLP